MMRAAYRREVDIMALVRSPQSLDRIKDLYFAERIDKMKLTSAFIHPAQKEIIDILSRETGKGKGAVVRDLIDEWVELQLKNGSSGS